MRKVSRSEDNIDINVKDAMTKESVNPKLATNDEKGNYKYIHKDGSEWVVVQKGTGKVLSRHKTEDDAIASFKAMMVSKHGSVVEAKTWPKNEDDSKPTPENPWYKVNVSGPEEWDYLHEDPEEHGYGSTISVPTSLPGLPEGMKINLPYETGLGSYIGVRHHPDKGLWEASVGEAGPGGKEMHSSFHSTREDAMSKAHDAWRTHFPRVFEGERFSSKQVQERREASFEERYASEEDPLAFAHSLQQAPKQNQQQQPISAPGNIAEEGAAEGAGIGELAGLAAVASKTAGQWGPTPGGNKNCIGMRNGRDKCIGELSKNGYPNKADGGSQCKQCEDYDSSRSSSKTAGAWPSETDWEGHLHNLEELLSETQKGVGWHAAKDEKKEMKAHDKLAKDLQKVIDDIKKVMKFPAAKTASVETEDWRDEHSNLDSGW